jgi:hypothetical protein
MTATGNVYGLLDLVRALDPSGKLVKPIEVLSQDYPLVGDLLMKEGNAPLAEVTKRRTGLPIIRKRRANKGVAPSKATTGDIVDVMMALEGHSEIDELVLKAIEEKTQYRQQEGDAFLESCGQSAENYGWNGNALDAPDEFTGILPRYDALGKQVLSAGGTTNLSSILLVGHGPNGLMGIYPRGSMAGLQRIDRQLQRIADTTGAGAAAYFAYVETIFWHLGITIKDPRAICRVGNIDTIAARDVVAGGTQAIDAYATSILQLMVEATHRVRNPYGSSLKYCWYMAPSMLAALDRQALAHANANVIETKYIDGMAVQTFRGMQVKSTDQLGYAEAQLA